MPSTFTALILALAPDLYSADIDAKVLLGRVK